MAEAEAEERGLIAADGADVESMLPSTIYQQNATYWSSPGGQRQRQKQEWKYLESIELGFLPSPWPDGLVWNWPGRRKGKGDMVASFGGVDLPVPMAEETCHRGIL